MSGYKRYPKYRDSGVEWIGEVPEGWETLKIKRLASLRSGEMIGPDRISQSGNYPVFGGNGLRGYTDSYTHNGDYALIGRQGALCGNINYARGKFWASEHAVVITCVRDVNTHWFGEMLRAANLNQYSTSAAQPGLSVEIISNLYTAAPPPAEQTAIASYLDRATARIDALVAKKTRFIALLKEKRQALITHAVTKGLDPKAKMKDSGVEWIGEVPEGWDVLRFKESVDSCQNGIWGDEPDGFNDIECVRVADFDRATLKVNHTIPTLRAVSLDKRTGRLLRQGNLLLEKSGGGENQPVGQVVLYDRAETAICSNFVAKVEIKAGMDARFWNYQHHAAYVIRLNVKSIKQTSGIQNLDQSQYLNEMAVFPPNAEQKRIADFLDGKTARIENLVSLTERSIALLKEKRSALITAAVTGQIDVRTEVSDAVRGDIPEELAA